MPTVLSSPFACSALTPPNRVKKKKKKGKKEGRNDTQRGKETGIGDYISGFVRLKVTRFQRKVELSYPFARTRAHAHAPARNRSKIVHISCNNGNRTFFSLSLYLSFVLNVAKISDFTRLLSQKTGGGFTVLEHSSRGFLVHQDAIVSRVECKKGWLRFR